MRFAIFIRLMPYTTSIITPVGTLIAGATDAGICLLDFPFRKSIEAIKSRISSALGDNFEKDEHPHFAALRDQLSEYFSGARRDFDLPLQLTGSDFQKGVWNALLQIPFGETRSYKAQSIRLKNEGAIRAIAKANGDNGLMLLVPCHRVIGEGGSLTGYAGGLKAKAWLLEHERKVAGKEVQGALY